MNIRVRFTGVILGLFGILICMISVYSNSMISTDSNSKDALDIEMRERFLKVTPTLQNIDLFWNKLSCKDRLALKGNPSAIDDDQFKQIATTLYLKIMLFQYRVLYYVRSLKKKFGSYSFLAKQPQPLSDLKLEILNPREALSKLMILDDLPLSVPFIEISTNNDKKIKVPKVIVKSLPLINDLVSDFPDDNITIPFLFEAAIIQKLILATWKIHELLTSMHRYTQQKYQVERIYTPADIPLIVRCIIKSIFKDKSTTGFANVIEAANYIRIPYLVDALAAEWVTIRFSSWYEKSNISPDVRNNYIQKYRARAQHGINYIFSMADFALLHARGAKIPDVFFLINNMLNLFENFPLMKLSTHDIGILNSLTGTEFLGITFNTDKINYFALKDSAPAMSKSKRNEIIWYLGTKDQISVHILDAYSFLGLSNITSLDINKCGIRSIDKSAFAGLPRLTNLWMRNSTFRVIGSNDLEFDNLIPEEQCLEIKNALGAGVNVHCGSINQRSSGLPLIEMPKH